jgi:hypothetical protein
MKLSIATLNEKKAFSAKPVPVVITWGEHSFDTFIRPLSYQTAIGDINAFNEGDIMAHRIASSVCDEDGKAVFTVADVTGQPVFDREGKLVSDPERGALDPALTTALIVAIGKVQNAVKLKS